MRYFIFVLILTMASACYADRVCIEKQTGKLIEYQSGNAALGTLTKNAINAGYDAKDVIEKYVTSDEWKAIAEEQIIGPAKEKAKQDEDARKLKAESIKAKLNLSNKEFEDLREAIK